MYVRPVGIDPFVILERYPLSAKTRNGITNGPTRGTPTNAGEKS